MSLIRRLCVEEGTGTELTNKLTETLKETLSDNKVGADTVLTISIKCLMSAYHEITLSLRRRRYRHEQIVLQRIITLDVPEGFSVGCAGLVMGFFLAQACRKFCQSSSSMSVISSGSVETLWLK